MKNKKLISKLLLFVFVASFLLQTGHSFEHLVLHQSKEICLHETSATSEKQITHSHDLVELCKVCSFSISSFIENSFVLFTLTDLVYKPIHSLSKNDQNISFYKGSLFALRAPPRQL